MKIIGYQTKGNAVRFYLGSYDLKPKYPKKNSTVATISITANITPICYKAPVCAPAPGILPYADFVTGWKDVYISWDKTAFTNPDACMEDLRAHNEPLIVIAVGNYTDSVCGFNKFKGGKGIQKFYLDDEMEPDEVGIPDDYPEKSIADQRLFLFL